jgi:hypothetical protein
LPEVEFIFFTPLKRLKSASNFDVTSFSITLGELPYKLYEMLSCGNTSEGESFTLSNGSSAKPTMLKNTKVRITEKDDILLNG